MRDEDDGAGVLAEKLLQPLDRLDVEVIGRLVEEQDRRLGDERAREKDAAAPPARERVRAHVGIETELLEHQLDALLERPAVGLVERLLRARERGHGRLGVIVGHACGGVVIGGEELLQRAEAFRDDIEDRLMAGQRHILDKSRSGGAGLAPDRAGVRRQLARENLQQRGLARAIAADDRYTLAGVHEKAGPVEERQMAERDRDLVE